MEHKIQIGQGVFFPGFSTGCIPFSNLYNGKKDKRLRIHLYNCYGLMTLFFNHVSTSFWEVPLMPAICDHSTMALGLRTPLQKQLLDYHSTINLAGCSRLLHLYRFVSIKYQMLVTLDIPHCLTNCGLKTLFSVSNNRFLLMTLFSYYNRSAY